MNIYPYSLFLLDQISKINEEIQELRDLSKSYDLPIYEDTLLEELIETKLK